MTEIRIIELAFDAIERSDGWYFRYPAGDERAAWFGPFISKDAAEKAALSAIETHLAQHVASELGL